MTNRIEAAAARPEEAAGRKYLKRVEQGEKINLFDEVKSQYGEEALVELSPAGLEAIESSSDELLEAASRSPEEKAALLEKELKPARKLHLIIPNIHTNTMLEKGLENVDEHIRDAAYDIIRNDMLNSQAGGLTEEERQAVISLGLEKAGHLAQNYMDEEGASQFLAAMENIAKYAANGQKDENGRIRFHIMQGPLNGQTEYSPNPFEIMKERDPEAYKKYSDMLTKATQKKGTKAALEALRYGYGWVENARAVSPEWFQEKADEYKGWQQQIQDTKVSSAFAGADKSGGTEQFVQSVIQSNRTGSILTEEFLVQNLADFKASLEGPRV